MSTILQNALEIVGSISAILTLVLGVIVVLYVQSQTRRREIELRHFDHKVERYEKFFDVLFKVFFGDKTGVGKPTERQLVKEMIEIKQVLTLWGSADTIRTFEAFGAAAQDDVDDAEKILLGDMLFMSMRKDLGHNDKSMKKGELTLFLVKDGNEKEMLRKKLKH